MDKVLGIASLILLVVAVVYLYFKVTRYRKLTKELGEKVMDIFPGQGRKYAVMIVGAIFIVIGVVGSILYLASGQGIRYMTVLVLDLVLLAGGRYLGKFVVMYQNGMLAHLHVLKYHEIKGYEFEALKSKKFVLSLKLQKDTSFRAIVNKKDKEAVEKALRRAV